jgi:hypothetical protein
MSDRPAEFGHTVALGDPGAFYRWVVGQFRWPEPAMGFAVSEKKKTRWNKEHDAMFDTDFHEEILCLRCDRRSQNNGNMPMIEVDGTTPHTTLDEMLHRGLFETWLRMHYETCRGPQPHRVIRKIWAAPQVLRIQVYIMGTAEDTNGACSYKRMTD